MDVTWMRGETSSSRRTISSRFWLAALESPGTNTASGQWRAAWEANMPGRTPRRRAA